MVVQKRKNLQKEESNETQRLTQRMQKMTYSGITQTDDLSQQSPTLKIGEKYVYKRRIGWCLKSDTINKQFKDMKVWHISWMVQTQHQPT